MRTLPSAAIAFMVACSSALPAAPNNGPDDDDVREAVFRYQFDKYRVASLLDAVCMEVEQSDPPVRFMARFAGARPPVYAASTCRVDLDGVEHGHAKALRFDVSAVQWSDPDHAVVKADYYGGGLASAEYELTVEHVGAAWKVAHEKLVWIS